mgnify:CR=1 FL=1
MRNLFVYLLCFSLFCCQEKKERSYLPDEKEYATDSTAVLLNETAARAMGWKENAVGATLLHSDKGGNRIAYHVIGVVKDFNFRSLHERISPLVMSLAPDPSTYIVKLKTTNVASLTAMLSKTWAASGAEDPMAFSFLDERFNNTYKSEQKTGSILGIFAGLTILVACLGLFGLAMFTAQQRTREIGIRKVLGASAGNIVYLFSKEFILLILIAFLIATPIVWYFMNDWLQDYVYRITISIWVFIVGGIVAIIIALATISFQAVKAAMANPVKSLKAD